MSMVTAGPQPGDAVLWERVAAGDHDAFGELFDKYAAAVYTYLFRRLGDWSEAEDLTSAVFLQAWRKRSEVVFDRDSALPWLFGVAGGLLRNATRSRRRHAALLERVRDAHAGEAWIGVGHASWVPGEAAVTASEADTVAERLDAQQRMTRIRAAIDRLPRHQREVIELCALGGLDQAAAAVALGVRPGTVKSRLHRARRALASELGTEGELL